MNDIMYKPKCRVLRPPEKEICGKAAKHRVIFSDGDKTTACTDCALYLKQTAIAHGGGITVENLDA